MPVPSRRQLILGTIGIALVALAGAVQAFAEGENFSHGPGDFGGTAGNPDDWGASQPGLLDWLVYGLRITLLLNRVWGLI